MRTSAVTAELPLRLEGAPAAATNGPVHAGPTGGRFLARGRRISLLCLAVVLADQASKAVQPAGTFAVNTGGPAVLSSALGDALWRSQTVGAACDSVGAVVLMAALGAVRTVTNTGHRVAVTAVLAGLLSNLVDRLGASSVFHAGLPRGCIDWISVPGWPSAKTNIADIVIALGVIALIWYAGRRTIHGLVHHVPTPRLAAVATGVLVLAVWTAVWQVNRHTAELGPTSRSERPSRCHAASVYSSDGMDWVSYRPAVGPLPYHGRPCR